MSFNCVKGNNKPAQGYLLCMTPLESHELEFPSCNVQGKIEGKLGTGVFPTSSSLIEKSLSSPRVTPHLNFFKGVLWGVHLLL